MFNKEKYWDLFFIVIFIMIPFSIYSLAIKLDSIWIIAIPYYLLLGVAIYYQTKFNQKNGLVCKLEEKFSLTKKLNGELKIKQDQHNYHDFYSKDMINDIKDSISRLR